MESMDHNESNNETARLLTADESYKRRGGQRLSTSWKIAMLIFSMYISVFSIGFGYSLSVLYAELVRAFNESRANVALIQSINMGISFGLAILWDYPFKRYGPGRCIIMGSVILSMSIFISAFSVNIGMLICFIGIIAGFASSVLNLGPYIIMGKIFGRQRTTVIAILTCGASIGQIVLTYAMEALIDRYGWSGALLIISALAMNSIPCCIVIHIKTASVPGLVENSDDNKLFKPFLVRDWRFILIVINAFVSSISIQPENKFLVDLAILKSFDQETGSLFASLIGVTSLAGRLIGAGINATTKGKSSLFLGLFVFFNGGAHILVLYSDTYNGLLTGALLSGLSLGLCVSQLIIIFLDVFPLEHYAAGCVFWNLGEGTGNIVGGYIGGIIADLTGGYDLVFLISTFCCVFNTICFVTVFVSLKIKSR